MSKRALLAVVLVACGSNAPPIGPSNKAPVPSYEAALDDVLGFLPADSEIVIGIEAKQIRTTAVWAQLAPRLEHLLGRDLTEIKAACGFDPMQTVDRISIGLRAHEHDRMSGVIVVRGVGARTMGCVRTRLGKPADVTDDKGVVVVGHPGDHLQSAFTMIGSTLIVQVDQRVGHDTMQAVLASGSPLRTAHAFMDLYAQLERGASAWGVVDGKTKLLDEADSTGMRPLTALATLTISDRVVISGRAVFSTADAAAKVDSVMRQALATAGKFTEHAESRQDGAQVIVGLSVSGAQLQTLLGFL